MKQTFTIEIESPDWQKRFDKDEIENLVLVGLSNCFRRESGVVYVRETTVEQSMEPLKDQEKTLKLSGNIAWENRIEDGDDYLEDRFNEILER